MAMGMDRRAEEVLSAMAFYFVISLSIVFLNYHIFTGAFQNPVFVSWFQQIVALVCVVVMGQVGKCNPALAFFPPYEFKLKTAKHVLPVTVTFVAMIAFANTCLKNVQVSTYQVGGANRERGSAGGRNAPFNGFLSLGTVLHLCVCCN